jgi:hypothetical protein
MGGSGRNTWSVVRKGFPVPPLVLPPVLQGEKEITKRDRRTDKEGENDETKNETKS